MVVSQFRRFFNMLMGRRVLGATLTAREPHNTEIKGYNGEIDDEGFLKPGLDGRVHPKEVVYYEEVIERDGKEYKVLVTESRF